MRKLTLIALLAAFAVPAAAEDGPKVLVLDLRKVIDESKESLAFIKKLRKEQANKQAEFAKEVKVLQQTQKELIKSERVDRDAKWYEAYRKVIDRVAWLKAEEQYFGARKSDEMGSAINQLILGAQMEARKIMNERNADMVLISRTGPVRINSDKDIQDEIIFRRVLCSKPDVDITAEVLKRMNAWYEEHRSAKGAIPEREAGSTGKKPAGKKKPEGGKRDTKEKK